MVEDEPLQVAVLRHEGDAALDGFGRRASGQRPSPGRDVAGEHGPEPEDRLQDLGATTADETGQAVDLSFGEGQVDAAQPIVDDAR